jgi:hypothetical protein
MKFHYLGLAVLAAVGCSKFHKPSMPSTPSVPGGMSGEVDPNTCGNYAASDAGARLKAFLQATKDLDAAAAETVKLEKESCVLMGQELGMDAGALRSNNDTKAVCQQVIDTYKHNLQVTLKAEGGIHIAFTPGHCEADASASAGASAQCAGQAGTGGEAGECQASAGINASVHANCTPPQLSIDIVKPALVLDTSKLQMTIQAMKDGLPKLFSATARLQLLKDATATWVQAAKDLKAMPAKFVQSFGDQATCVGLQITNAVNASTHIQANISVSVSVSASASGSVGAGG